MPVPSVLPMPPGPALRPFAPLLAHEASYLAASARMASFCAISTCAILLLGFRIQPES
jgi:hypothetical protein